VRGNSKFFKAFKVTLFALVVSVPCFWCVPNATIYAGAATAGTYTWNQLKQYLSYGTSITLTSDVKCDNPSGKDNYLFIPKGKNITLDLNGHTIDRALTASTTNGEVIRVEGTLTITGNGVIKGGFTSTNGGGINVNNGELIMKNGEISRNTALKKGAGVYVSSASSFVMDGGKICNNYVKSGNDLSGNSHGGGVSIHGGSFTMNNGAISGNRADAYGGGVSIDNYSGSYGVFNLNSGSISGNYAGRSGGGVYIKKDSTMNLKDASVTGNTSAWSAAGIYDNGILRVSGYTLVEGNNSTRSGSAPFTSNVHLPDSNTDSIQANGLRQGSNIGVSRETYSGKIIATGVLESEKESFFSDDDNHDFIYSSIDKTLRNNDNLIIVEFRDEEDRLIKREKHIKGDKLTVPDIGQPGIRVISWYYGDNKTEWDFNNSVNANLILYAKKEKIFTDEAVTISNAVYSGVTQKPEFKWNNEPLTLGTDYTITPVTSMKNAGNYSVTITAIGKYGSSSVTKTFTIAKKNLIVKANDHTIYNNQAPENNGVAYDGFVNGENAGVLKGTLAFDYTYRQNAAPGVYKITPKGLSSDNYNISFQSGNLYVNAYQDDTSAQNTSDNMDGTSNSDNQGNSSEQQSSTEYQNPVQNVKSAPEKIDKKQKNPGIKSVKAKGKNITITWKKGDKKLKGYEIQYSTDKKFKKNVKSVKISKIKTTSKTIKKLKKGTYYIRIRTYKTDKKKVITYSAWSKSKKVKIK